MLPCCDSSRRAASCRARGDICRHRRAVKPSTASNTGSTLAGTARGHNAAARSSACMRECHVHAVRGRRQTLLGSWLQPSKHVQPLGATAAACEMASHSTAATLSRHGACGACGAWSRHMAAASRAAAVAATSPRACSKPAPGASAGAGTRRCCTAREAHAGSCCHTAAVWFDTASITGAAAAALPAASSTSRSTTAALCVCAVWVATSFASNRTQAWNTLSCGE